MIVALNRKDKVTFNASVDNTGHVGSVNLEKTEVEKFRSAMEPTGKHFLLN